MAGIYLHIPYCKQKCSYCNFHFSTLLSTKEKLVEAMVQEIELRKSEHAATLSTIYLGGGTPSLLSTEELKSLFLAIQENFKLESLEEFTLEANPEDINLDTLNVWKDIGVNRLSIGVQSFHEEDLQLMHRIHSAQQSIEAIQLAQSQGFSNITIDLIYGSPSTSDEMWQQNLDQLLELNIPHFSAYALTVEPKTLLSHSIQKGKLLTVSDETQARHFQILQGFITHTDYHQYEVSNFSKEGKEAIHNSNYWKGLPYIGIGPSAHSYNGKDIRKFNIANNAQYIQRIKAGEIPETVEKLSDSDQYNEWAMIGLRSRFGLKDSELQRFPKEIQEHFLVEVEKYLHDKTIRKEDGIYYLDPSYYFQADGIASDLFYV